MDIQKIFEETEGYAAKKTTDFINHCLQQGYFTYDTFEQLKMKKVSIDPIKGQDNFDMREEEEE